MNYKGVIFLVIISIVLGCKFQNDTNITKIKLEATNLNIEKWISKSTKGYLYGHRFFQIEDTDLLYYFSMLDTSIYIETFKEERLKKSFSIKFLMDSLNISLNDLKGFYLPNEKEAWVSFYSVENQIFRIFLNEFELKSYFVQNNGFIERGFFANINCCFIYDSLFLTPIISSNTERENHVRFPIGIFKIKDNEVDLIEKVGTYPSNYNIKNMYDNFNQITKISNDSILVSFLYNDTVDLYVKEKLDKRIILKSDSSKEFLGFSGSEFDINAIKVFNLSMQRYERLIYDKSNQLYYRIFTFNAPKSNKGKIEMSQVWSLNIFDKNFNKVGEQMFKYKEYDKFNIFIHDKGIYLINYSQSVFGKNMSDSSKITFQKFNLIENEL